MSIIPRNFFIAAIGVVALSASSWVVANDDDDHQNRSSICQVSADEMFQSCRSEVDEEYHATAATCINLGDADDRRECLEGTKETRLENRKGCSDQREARKAACDLLGENRYDPEGLLDTHNFVTEPDGSNPYFSLAPGQTYVARAGENFEETNIVTVTDEVREVLGVNCRRVADVVLVKEDDEFVATEVTDDYYAQALNGDVHYCGEVARNFEEGILVNLDGSFEAGRDLAKSGIIIKAQPIVGDTHRQEYLLGEAEDLVRYVAGVDKPTSVGKGEGGENPNFPCEGNCVKTEEFNPTEPGAGEFKYYLPGTGFVLAVGLEDGKPTGERDEVLCTGNSLDVLSDPSCGIKDPSALLDQLCELSPAAFCD